MGEIASGVNQLLPFPTWNVVQYGMACVFFMGINTLWRFPYCVYKYSGLFLVAYYIMMALIAAPLCWLQLRLGQIYRRGAQALFGHFLPALKGGATLLLLWAFLQGISNSVMMTHCLCYMFKIMASGNGLYPWEVQSNYSVKGLSDGIIYDRITTPAHDFYYTRVLDTMGTHFPWEVLLCFFLVMFFTFLPLLKMARSFGLMVYVSCPATLALLASLSIYAQTIPSGTRSMADFFSGKSSPQQSVHPVATHQAVTSVFSSSLSSPTMWIDALDLHVVSLALWAGVLPTMGAHLGNRKRNRILSVVLLLLFTLVPYLFLLMVAPLLGALTHKQHNYLAESTQPGFALLFVAVPDAVSNLGITKSWICLFYFSVFLLSIHYQVLLVLTLAENIIEIFPTKLLSKVPHPAVVSAGVVLLMTVLGIPQITTLGIEIMQVLDLFLYRLLFLAIAMATPVFVVAYIRVNPLYIPIERWSFVGICVLSAVGTIIIDLYREAEIRPMMILHSHLSTWQHVIGHLLSVGTFLLCLFAGLIHAFITCDGTAKERILKIIKPSCEDLRAAPSCFETTSPDTSSVTCTVASEPTEANNHCAEMSVEVPQTADKVDSV